MLSGISKAARNWVAMSFIALYALCIVAPTAALALSAVSCLTEHSQPQAHSHTGDASDEHSHSGSSDHHDDGSNSSKCCGMIFCSALVPDTAVSLAPAALSDRTSPASMRDFTGLPPHKLIRPPRSHS